MKRLATVTNLLVALAILARVTVILVLQSHLVPRSTYEHGEIAANLLAGHGFSVVFLGVDGPTSQQAPLYPVIVALSYAIGGVATPQALLLLELVQAVLGGVLVLGVLRLMRAVAPHQSLAGPLAGLLVAIHPTLVYAATHVQVAIWGATLLVWALYWSYRTGESGRLMDAVVAGVLLGLLTLTDPILALGGVGMIWAMSLRGDKATRLRPPTGRLVAACLAATAVVIAPWIIRNALVHGEFVAIKSTFGYAFWQGNCSLSEGTDKVVRPSVERVMEGGAAGGLSEFNRRLWAARHEAGYIDDIALNEADRRQLARVTEPERSRILFLRALEELRQQPGRYLSLCLRRFRYFWLFDETNPKTRAIVYRTGHLGLTVLALLGLVLAPTATRWRLAPTVVTALLIALFHTLTIVSARFHIPIEPLMAVWAGSGLGWGTQARRPALAAPRHHIVGVRVVHGLRRFQLLNRG